MKLLREFIELKIPEKRFDLEESKFDKWVNEVKKREDVLVGFDEVIELIWKVE